MAWVAERPLLAAQLSRLGLSATEIALAGHLIEHGMTPEDIAARVQSSINGVKNAMNYRGLFARSRPGRRANQR